MRRSCSGSRLVPEQLPDVTAGTLREHHRGHARPRTSTANYASSAESVFLRVFRARGFPALPSVPASLLDGKEGVDGSSPSEGLKRPANQHFVLSVLIADKEGVRAEGATSRSAGVSSAAHGVTLGRLAPRGRTRVAPCAGVAADARRQRDPKSFSCCVAGARRGGRGGRRRLRSGRRAWRLRRMRLRRARPPAGAPGSGGRRAARRRRCARRQ